MKRKNFKVKLEIDVSSISDTSDSEPLFPLCSLLCSSSFLYDLNAKFCLNRSTVSTLCKATHKQTQRCWMLHVASVYTSCCMLLSQLELLRIVGSCCIRFSHYCHHGGNDSQHCWSNSVGSCCVLLNVAKRLQQ